MPINIVQAAHNTKSGTFPGTAQPDSVSASFTSTSAHNTIVVVVTADCITGGAGVAANGVSDPTNGSYTQLYYGGDATYPGGPLIGVYVFHDIAGGAVTISFSATARNIVAGISYTIALSIFELSGMPSAPSLQSSGAILNAPGVTITLTDSNGVSVTSNAGSGSTFNAYEEGFAVVDLFSTGANFFIAVYVNPGGTYNNPPTVSPSGYMAYTLEDSYTTGLTAYVFFRSTPINTTVQPQVYAVT